MNKGVAILVALVVWSGGPTHFERKNSGSDSGKDRGEQRPVAAKVLVAGGTAAAKYLASAELYDEATGTWTTTGPLATPRFIHEATLLLSGKVLVVGGANQTDGIQVGNSLASAELYDEVTGSWTATGALATGRYLHTVTSLLSGRVLAVGGRTEAPAAQLANVESYVESTRAWAAAGSLVAARTHHTATLLASGKVLIAGGATTTGMLATAELYDGRTGVSTITGSLRTPRYNHTATLLKSGKVLVVGGAKRKNGQKAIYPLASSELYDPVTGIWTTTGSLATARYLHTATLLFSGKVLVVGGNTSGLASGELYDPATGTWMTTSSLTTGRCFHTTTLLPSGKVIVAGGSNDSTGDLASAELYDESTGTWTRTGSLVTARSFHTATLLSSAPSSSPARTAVLADPVLSPADQ